MSVLEINYKPKVRKFYFENQVLFIEKEIQTKL